LQEPLAEKPEISLPIETNLTNPDWPIFCGHHKPSPSVLLQEPARFFRHAVLPPSAIFTKVPLRSGGPISSPSDGKLPLSLCAGLNLLLTIPAVSSREAQEAKPAKSGTASSPAPATTAAKPDTIAKSAARRIDLRSA